MRPSRILTGLTQPAIIFYALPWVMVLLILGTITQRYAGLYVSEHLFFSSFIFWFRGVPLPGMLSILALLGVSLIAKIILKSPWRRPMIGTLITHLGALLLLLGGLLTAVTSHEGNMVLAAGQAQNFFTDYHQRELVVMKNGGVVFTCSVAQLRKGDVIHDAALPFQLSLQTICRNCDLAREERLLKLSELPPNKTDEANRAGIAFNLSDGLASRDYTALESAPPVEIKRGKDRYGIAIQKHAYDLPFAVRLDELREDQYPGTDIAREYQSLVTITDGAVHWQAPIRMNEPLRYRGYTFYQAEIDQVGPQRLSVLAVVRNTGRVFPYIAGLVMAVGMITHLMISRKIAP